MKKIKVNPELRGYALAVEVLARIELAEAEADRTGDIPAERTMPGWNQELWGILTTDDPPPDNDGETVVEFDAITGLPDNAQACGTAFCVAGWAAVLTSEHIGWRGTWWPRTGRTEWYMHGVEDVTVSTYAGERMELSGEADVFRGNATLEDLYWELANAYGVFVTRLRSDVQDRVAELKVPS